MVPGIAYEMKRERKLEVALGRNRVVPQAGFSFADLAVRLTNK